MKQLLRECSPHHHPRRWIFVNCSILLWSAFILVGIISTFNSHNDNEKNEAEYSYLLYNFGTCAVWLIEVLFHFLDYRKYFDFDTDEGVNEESLLQPTVKAEKTRREVAALWIEGFFAVLFFVDSTTVALNLSREQIHKQAQGMVFDVVLNMAAYGFMVYRVFDDWRGSQHNSVFEEERDDDAKQLSSSVLQSDGLV